MKSIYSILIAILYCLICSCYTKNQAIEKFCSKDTASVMVTIHDTIRTETIRTDTVFNDTIDSGITEDEDEEDVENLDEGFDFDDLDTDINNDNTMSIVTFLTKIKNASFEYSKLYHGDNDDIRIRREIKSLNKIQCEPAYIFLIQFMNLDIENYINIDVIKILASLMLRRHICKRQTGETDQIFSSLVRVIDLIEDRELFIQTLKDSILDKENVAALDL